MEKIKIKNSNLWSIFRGSFIAVSISLMLILLFALLIKFLNINENLIMPINQIIKIVSIFFGVFLTFNFFNKNKGFIKGFLIGIIYTILAYLIFSILAGKFSFTLTSLTDMLFGGIIGGLSGIIVVNLKNR